VSSAAHGTLVFRTAAEEPEPPLVTSSLAEDSAAAVVPLKKKMRQRKKPLAKDEQFRVRRIQLRPDGKQRQMFAR
jgi:hypothetical protein